MKISSQPLMQEVEARMQSQFAGHPSALVDMLEQLILAGGERIRLRLTLLIGSMFNVERETLLNLAAAVEMLHTATLVHDDLVDESDRRRGRKTLNSSFQTSATVLTGDLAFAAAARLAASTGRVAVMEKFSEALQFIVSGEITYMFSNGSRADRETYFHWIHAKTASIFELAAKMAASIGTATPEEIAAAHQFGYGLGMALQIFEDVLDFSGETPALGRPIGSNLRQGLLTLPMLYYLEAHPDDPIVESILHHNGYSQEDLERLIANVRQSTAIQQALEEAQRFLQPALKALDKLPTVPEREELNMLATTMIHPHY